MDPAALEALPTEKAFKMTLKRGQVPSAKKKLDKLPKFKIFQEDLPVVPFTF